MKITTWVLKNNDEGTYLKGFNNDFEFSSDLEESMKFDSYGEAEEFNSEVLLEDPIAPLCSVVKIEITKIYKEVPYEGF